MRFVIITLLLAIAVSSIDANTETCEWRGSAPVCFGSCEVGERVVKSAATATEAIPYQDTFGKECMYGKKFYCCKQNDTTVDDSDLNRVNARFPTAN